MQRTHAYRLATTFAIALFGVGIFSLLHVPLPWLLGSISALAIASRFPGLSLAKPTLLSAVARAILGLAIGSAFGPHVLEGAGVFLGSLAFIFPFVGVTTALGVWYYKSVVGYDTRTAFFSAIPGGLLEMVSLAEYYKADLRKVVLNQSARLLLIVFSVPFLVEYLTRISLDGAQSTAYHFGDVSWLELGAMGVCVAVGWRLAVVLKIPGGTLLGPMALGMVVYTLGFIEARPPMEIINLIQLVLGATVGFVFVGTRLQEMAKITTQALGYFCILVGVSGFFMALVWYVTGFSFVSVLLAFAPGGQAEMNVIALVVGASLPYVALHHVVRLFFVIGLAPLVLRWSEREKR